MTARLLGDGVTSAPPECDARIDWTQRPEGWGRTPRYCLQRVGLRAFRDAAGRTRHHCSRAGHRDAAVRRYGVWEQSESELRALAGDR